MTSTADPQTTQSPNLVYGVVSSEARIGCAHRRGLEQPPRVHDVAARIDEGADARDGRVHHPPSVLDRAEAAHLQVLLGCRGPVVGRVVDRDHEEPGAEPHHLPVDRREAVLVADRGPERRQAGERDERDLLPRDAVDRDLLGGRDPAQHVAERHVLTERHEVHLRVLVHDRPRPVERERHRSLVPLRIAGHRSGERRHTDGRDDVHDRTSGLGVVQRARVERALAPDDQVGGIGGERAVPIHVQHRHGDVLGVADEMLHGIHVHLDDRDVDGLAVGGRRGRDRRRRDHDDPGQRGRPERPHPTTTPPPLEGEQHRSGDEHHQEGEPQGAGDRGEREGGSIHLRRGELAPREPSERERAPDPLDQRPERGEAERPEQRMLGSPHRAARGRRRRPRTPPTSARARPTRAPRTAGSSTGGRRRTRARTRTRTAPRGPASSLARARGTGSVRGTPAARSRPGGRPGTGRLPRRPPAGGRWRAGVRRGLRRSPGRASSPCPSAGSDASPGSSSSI